MEKRFLVKNILGLSIFAILFSLGVAFSPTASALTVSPYLAELSLTPGVATKAEIKLFNETEKTLTIYPEIVSWAAQDETGTPAFDLEAEVVGFPTWVKLPDGPFLLDPLETTVIPITITTPEDAPPGGHYAAVFFSENPPETTGASQVAIGYKVTTLYLARVAGDVLAQGSIRSLTTSHTTYNRLPVDFFIRFENTGNIHLRPTGTITVTNMFGKTTGEIDVNVTKGATLPEQIRQYTATWERHVADSEGAGGWTGFWTEFGNEWNNLALGKYTATTNLSSETEEGFLTHSAETAFWVFPWRVIIVVVVGALAILFLLFCLMHQYNKWIIKKAHEHTASTEKTKKK